MYWGGGESYPNSWFYEHEIGCHLTKVVQNVNGFRYICKEQKVNKYTCGGYWTRSVVLRLEKRKLTSYNEPSVKIK